MSMKDIDYLSLTTLAVACKVPGTTDKLLGIPESIAIRYLDCTGRLLPIRPRAVKCARKQNTR